MIMTKKKIGIVGVGLIGGSFGLALQKAFPEAMILGWDENNNHLETALRLGIIEGEISSLAELITSSDQIYLAIPVHHIEESLAKVLDQLDNHQFVVDFGSTKEQIVRSVKDHPRRSQYIAAHPIAGTENSGPEAGLPDLFADQVMIICDANDSNASFLADFENVCRELKMRLAYLNSQQHDLHLAYVSHLSHVLSFALSNTVLEKEKSDNHILELAGSGFESTVRLAKSSPEMWTPIFLKNSKFLKNGVDEVISELQKVSQALAQGDVETLRKFLESGRQIRKILE